MMWPSAAVIVSSGPIGAAPCETHGEHLDAVEPHADRAARRPPPRRGTAPRRRRRCAPDASPPSSGSSGDASAEEAQHGVGREAEGVGEQDRAGGAVEVRQPGQRARALLELLDGGVERLARSPSPSDAAQTDTAVPSSISRPSADHAARAAADQRVGREHLVDASSVASGAARCAPDANTIARSQRPAVEPARRRRGRLERACARRRASVERPVPMRTLMPSDDTPAPCRPPLDRRDLRADRGRQDRGRDRARRAPARRGRGPGGGLGRRDAGLRRAADPHRRGDRSRARAARAPAGRRPAGRPRRSAPAPTRAWRTPRSTALLAAGRRPIVVGGTGLYLRAALAELDLRPPAPAGPRAPAGGAAGAAAPAALHAELAARAPGAAAGIEPDRRASASCARSSCSTPARSRRRPPAATRSCGPPRRATRRCSPAW